MAWEKIPTVWEKNPRLWEKSPTAWDFGGKKSEMAGRKISVTPNALCYSELGVTVTFVKYLQTIIIVSTNDYNSIYKQLYMIILSITF